MQEYCLIRGQDLQNVDQQEFLMMRHEVYLEQLTDYLETPQYCKVYRRVPQKLRLGASNLTNLKG
jgi:predicted SPOUT superfamily RNA methylase MTH1